MTGGTVLATRVGPIVVSVSKRMVEIDGVIVRLTRAEMAVLAMLVQAAPDPVPRPALEAAARLRPIPAGRNRLVDQRIHTLRRKLGDDARGPALIVSVVGVGYALECDAASVA